MQLVCIVGVIITVGYYYRYCIVIIRANRTVRNSGNNAIDSEEPLRTIARIYIASSY